MKHYSAMALLSLSGWMRQRLEPPEKPEKPNPDAPPKPRRPGLKLQHGRFKLRRV
jgi:hypothetical protein